MSALKYDLSYQNNFTNECIHERESWDGLMAIVLSYEKSASVY